MKSVLIVSRRGRFLALGWGVVLSLSFCVPGSITLQPPGRIMSQAMH